MPIIYTAPSTIDSFVTDSRDELIVNTAVKSSSNNTIADSSNIDNANVTRVPTYFFVMKIRNAKVIFW